MNEVKMQMIFVSYANWWFECRSISSDYIICKNYSMLY